MHMKSIRRAFAGIGAGLITLLFTTTPAADAATHHTTTATASARGSDICTTGFRGQPAYDRACLTVGNYLDARREWRTGYTAKERRAQCRTALTTGMHTVVIETRGDVIRDTYVNDKVMIRMTEWAGAAECFRIGIG